MIDEEFGKEEGIPGFDVPLFQSPGSGEVDGREVGISIDEVGPMIEAEINPGSTETEATPVEPATEGPDLKGPADANATAEAEVEDASDDEDEARETSEDWEAVTDGKERD